MLPTSMRRGLFMAYVPLHVHSVYSGSESMMTIRDLVSRASYLGFHAVALTDHWSTYGHHEFFGVARQSGIKPIFGAEIRHASLTGSGGFYHLTALAESDVGYRNLIRLVTAHSTKDREPHVTSEELAEHRDGLIILSGCTSGEAAQAILHGTLGRARNVIERLVEIFGSSNVFAEIMNHDIEQEMLVMDQLKILAGKLGIPVVATNNDRYLLKEDAAYFKILKSFNKKQLNETAVPRVEEFYLKRERDLLPFLYMESEPLDRAGEIADRCSVDLSASGRIQFSALPSPDEWLTNMCRRRFVLTFHGRPRDERSYLKTVMTRELEVAREQGLCDFLVFFRELLLAAGRRGIWLELIGGELLDSLIAYLLEIVPLNPVDHDLVFESFAGRSGSLPSVELITSEREKGVFLEMLEELLPGYRPSFQVVEEEMSLATIAKEVGELLGAPAELREAINRALIYEKKPKTLAALLESSEAMRHLYTNEQAAKDILQSAFALQGRLVHLTQNSSRIVLVPPALEGFASFTQGNGGERFVQLSASAIEQAGGWIVGIQHSHFLSSLARAVEEMRKTGEGKGAAGLFKTSETGTWAPEHVNDPATYALIGAGETVGVYLLESQGIRDHLVRIKPVGFDELVNVISLYRPGPLEGKLWERYVDNADKKGKVYLPHHALASPLETTRGILLYGEQVREILEQTAGLTGDRAVAVERALRSREAGELVTARLTYIRGAMDVGLDEEEAQKIFDYVLHNIAFTHRKALSVAQAYLSYRTAFLKAHAFEPFFLALLNSNLDVSERQAKYIAYLKSKGTAVLPSSINASAAEYSLEEGGVRAPLRSIGSIERHEWEEIFKERGEHGDFPSLQDFLERMSGRVSEGAVLDLVESGAFDETGVGREALKASAKRFFINRMQQGFYPAVAAKVAISRKRRGPEQQMSLFDAESGGTAAREEE
jgi:DNA polymerase-3 subunit alpha